MPKIIYILPINFDYKVNAKEIFNDECEIKRQEIIKYFKDQKIKAITSNDMNLFEDGIHLNNNGHETMASLVDKELQKYE